MKKLFYDTRILDKQAQTRFCLSEEILMENAAAGLERVVRDTAESLAPPGNTVPVLIVTGSGGNGADGYTLARRLHDAELFPGGKPRCNSIFSVSVYEAKPAKTPLCRKQKERALACGVRFCTCLEPAWILVDCLFGSGFTGEPEENIQTIISGMNSLKNPAGEKSFIVACDVPSGLPGCTAEPGTADSEPATGGECSNGKSGNGCGTKGTGSNTRNYAETAIGHNNCVAADVTVCMGALKTSLFTDTAADYTGKIITSDLGIPRHLFEQDENDSTSTHGVVPVEPTAYLLEETDMILPYRRNRNVHKGVFGHAAIFCGGKPGAGITAATAAAAFGAGLTTLVFTGTNKPGTTEHFMIPPELMVSDILPENCTAIAAGMGLQSAGCTSDEIFTRIAGILHSRTELTAVLDADFLSWNRLPELLHTAKNRLVLTPHPKELAALYEHTMHIQKPVYQIQEPRKRLAAVQCFCETYPGIVLVAKGTFPVIGFCPEPGAETMLYVNPLGAPNLAKGGSGDVLAGLICGLLAQGYKPLDATITASLVHAAASRYAASDWGLSPARLITAIRDFPAIKKTWSRCRQL